MDNKVILERIQVKKLFNQFTYDINLKNGHDVAIIIAPNGCGKTTIFSMIDFIFRPTLDSYNKISSIPFESFICTLSNGRRIGLEIKNIEPDSMEGPMMRPAFPPSLGAGISRLQRMHRDVFCIIEDENSMYELGIMESIRTAVEIIENDIINNVDYSREDSLADLWAYSEEDETSSEYIQKKKRVTKVMSSEMEFAMERFRKEHHCEITENYISADRLYSKKVPGWYGRSVRARVREKEVSPLEAMQKMMGKLYSRTDREYRRLVSEARDMLPKMYLEAKDTVDGEFDTFKKEWEQYLEDMDKLYELGLIDSNQNILEVKQLKEAYYKKGSFLIEYLKAFKPTLEPWLREYDKLKLLSDIFNERNKITFKKLKYGPRGIVISVGGETLSVDCLSSGEKNDLVMFYNLLFDSEENSLVLIDEPEISLHIEWQEEYLDYLIEICKLNQLQAIVATHSPNIVNGHFELYAERGLQDELRGN